ncbi:MAG: SRPBCC domain-containing protein [Chloroflexota bacterium]
MKVIETSIVIEASADHVWRLLTDLDRYVNWNPFIVFASGHVAIGEPIRLRMAADMMPPRFHQRITVMNVNDYTLCWTTSGFTSRLFKTDYCFRIEPLDAECVRFIQRESMSGWIPVLLSRRHRLYTYMVSMDKALKRLAENKRYPLPISWTMA